MATYGASIAPKVFRQTGYALYTRKGLAAQIARALDAVGMQFCDAIAPYNILDPTLSESSIGEASTEAAVFVFDFPTTEYFSLRWTNEAADRQYRPCFVMTTCAATNITSAASASNWLGFHLAFRPNQKNFSLTDITSFNSLRNSPTIFHGLAESGGGFTTLDLGRQLGCPTMTSWKPYAAYALSNQLATMQVRNITAHLGPGGLFVSGGSNDQTQDKTGLFDLFNIVCFFGGERIPNRSKLSGSDPELPRFCPVMQLQAHTNNDVTWYDTRRQGPNDSRRVLSLAVQQGTRNSLQDGQAVYTPLYALDLLDKRLGDIATFPTYVSPTIVSSVPRNLLSPVVVVPRLGFTTSSPAPTGNYYPMTADGAASLQTWEDFYYAPSFRTSDPQLAIGEVTDPDTSIKWWGHWINDCSAAVAYKLGSSYTFLSTLPTKSYGGTITSTWDFSNVTVVSGVDIPIGTGIQSITNVSYAYISGTTGAFAQVTGPNQDYFQSSIGLTLSNPSAVFLFDYPSSVDELYQVEVTFSAFLRGGQENNVNHTLSLEYQTNTLDAATWQSFFSMQSAGANTGNASWNYTNRGTFRLRLGAVGTNGKVKFRVNCNRNSSSGTNPQLAQVGGISLVFKKWQ